MKYKVGDKVRVVSEKTGRKRKWKWNPYGEMDKYLGTIMTIREVRTNFYKMVEDRKEHNRDGWSWYPHMIEGLADEKENKNDLRTTDRKK